MDFEGSRNPWGHRGRRGRSGAHALDSRYASGEPRSETTCPLPTPRRSAPEVSRRETSGVVGIGVLLASGFLFNNVRGDIMSLLVMVMLLRLGGLR